MTLLRSPASVMAPGVEATSSSSAAPTSTSSRWRSTWLGRSPEDLVELGHRGLHHVGVRDPGAVEARAGLALLVGRHRLDRALVGLGVLARRDQRGHAAHRVRAAPVAGLDQQLAVGLHERHGHLHVVAVGQDELRPLAEGLDGREDVVPAPRVQRARVRAQLVEDLLHLEGGGQRLDEHRRLDRARVEPELALGEGEDLGPQPRLEVRLHLGQVEVRARALLEQALGVAHEVEPGVDEGARDRLAVDAHVLLDQVPAARAHEQRRDLVAELVLAPVVAGELDRALDRVGQVDLALDDVGPRRRQRVLEVGHEPARARVQRVDDHLAVDRAGDLDAPVLQGRRRRPRPASRPRGCRAVSGRKSSVSPAAIRARRCARASSSSRRRGSKRSCSAAEEGEGVVGEDAGGGGRGEDVDGHGFLPWIEAASSSIG